MTLSLRSPIQQTLLCGMAVAVAISCFFAMPAPQARAAELTEDQIRSIVELLVAFDVDPETVGTVNAILRGEDRTPAPQGEVLAAMKGKGIVPVSANFGGTVIEVPLGSETLAPDTYPAPAPKRKLPAGVKFNVFASPSLLDIAGRLQAMGIDQPGMPDFFAEPKVSNAGVPRLPATRESATGSYVPLYRFVSGNDRADWAQASKSGWTRELLLGYVAKTSGSGLAPLHQCLYTIPSFGKNYASVPFVGSNPKCPPADGAQVSDEGVSGYVWVAAGENLTPVYVCLRRPNGGFDAYSSLNSQCSEGGTLMDDRPFYVSKVSAPQPLLSIRSNPQSVVSGESATITWSAQNVSSCSVTSGDTTLGTGLSGSKRTAALTETAIYTLSCAGMSASSGISSASASVIVLSNPDTTPPTVALSSPTNKQRVRGNVYVSASATDPRAHGEGASGIASVTFSVDNKVISTDTAAPWGFLWDTASDKVATGTHTVSATARDKVGNTLSDTHSVTVAKVADPISLNRLWKYVYTHEYFHESVSVPLDNFKVQGYNYVRKNALGYVANIPSGTSVPADMRPIYDCLVNYNPEYGLQDNFTSFDKNCDVSYPASNQGLLGYVWTNPGSDRQGLYRCSAVGNYSPWFTFGFVDVFFIDRYDSNDSWCGQPQIPLKGPNVGPACSQGVGSDSYAAYLYDESTGKSQWACVVGHGTESAYLKGVPSCGKYSTPAGWQYVEFAAPVGYDSEGNPTSSGPAYCHAYKEVTAQQYYHAMGGKSPSRLLGYVSTAAALPVSLSLSVSSSTVNYGAQPLVEWVGGGVTSCAVTLGGAEFATGAAGQQRTPELIKNSSVRLSCKDTLGKTFATSTSIIVVKPDQASCTLVAVPESITRGKSTTLSWTAQNADTGSISGGVGTTTPLSEGDTTVSPVRTTKYTMTVINKAGMRKTCSATVTVAVDSEAPTISFVTPPANATITGTAALSVQFSDNIGVTRVRMYDGAKLLANLRPTSNTLTHQWSTKVADNGPHTLSAVALDAAGNRATSTVAVTVANALPPALSITASPNPVTYNQAATLTWSAQNVAECGIFKNTDPAPIGGGLSGTRSTGRLTSPAVFTLGCKDATGSTFTESVTVMVNAPTSYAPENFVASVVASPYGLAVNTLADIFHAFGVGKDDSAVEQTVSFAQDYSYAFNENFAAVLAAPYDAAVAVVTDTLISAGVGQSAAIVNIPALRNVPQEVRKEIRQEVKNIIKEKVGSSTPPSARPTLTITAEPKRVAKGGTVSVTWSAKNVVPKTCTILFGTRAIARGNDGSTTTPKIMRATPVTLRCVVPPKRIVEKMVLVGIANSNSTSTQERPARKVPAPTQAPAPAPAPEPTTQEPPSIEPAPEPVVAPESQGAALGLVQFLSDYSDAFNANLAVALSAPFNAAVDSLTRAFLDMGVGDKLATSLPTARLSITANPLNVVVNERTTIKWSASYVRENSCKVSINGEPFATGSSGTKKSPPLKSTTRFVLTCRDIGGAQVKASVPIGVVWASGAATPLERTLAFAQNYSEGFNKNLAAVVSAPYDAANKVLTEVPVSIKVEDEAPPAELGITATPSSVVANQRGTISWSAKKVQKDSCTVTVGGKFFASGPKGSKKTPRMSTSTRFTLTCTSLAGKKVKASAAVDVVWAAEEAAAVIVAAPYEIATDALSDIFLATGLVR